MRTERHLYVLDPGHYVDGAGVVRCRFCFSDLAHTKTDCFTKRSALMAKAPSKNRHKATRGKAAKEPVKRGPGRPRQQALIEDARIKPLEDVAAAYADVRDQRIALNQEEAQLKQTALKLMKKYEKTIYRSAGVEIRIVPGEEDVKVKIRKPEEEEESVDVQVTTGSTNGDGAQAEA